MHSQFSEKVSLSILIKKHFCAYGIILLAIIASTPLNMLLALFLGYVFKAFQNAFEPLTWTEFLGEYPARWIQPFVRNTPWHAAIPAEFHTQWFPWILLGIAFLLFCLRIIQEYLIESITERMAFDFRNRIFEAFLTQNFRAAQNISEGLLASLVGDDVRETRLMLTRLFASIPAEILISVTYIAMLCFLHTQLFLIFLAVMLPAVIIIRLTGKALKKLARQGLEVQTHLLNALLEKFQGWQTIHTYKAGNFETTQFSKLNTQLFHTWRRSARAKALGSPAVETLAIFAFALVLIVAFNRVQSTSITSTTLTTFFIILALLANSLQSLTTHLNSIKKGQESWRRLVQFISQNSPVCSITPPETQSIHSVVVNNLSWGAPSLVSSDSRTSLAPKVLQQNVSFSLKRGDFAVITGPSGCGKSTLLRILLGLEQPIEGEIIINNTPNLLLNACRAHVGLVTQDPFIFNGTILENMCYPRWVYTLQKHEYVAMEKLLHKLGLTLPLDRQTAGLSGGEKQRLALARALFHNPQLLLIDEGTSAIDLATEELILQTLKDTAADRMTLMVSHRPTPLKYATHHIALRAP